ncbi:LPXTG cell wall anchor domain-containing protein [Listeria monocytogenes]|nr:LPXTG cell wall anchor domain-containing protein [Listeria monocytogenes]EIZ6653594.1 LPXTG cell wall anchor domain-containing protein [Listeria monocytogenes]
MQLADGTTKKVEAKEIGADVQKDGTVTVKGSDGKMKVLPKTGETANIALSVMGSLTALASGFFLFKRNKKEQA